MNCYIDLTMVTLILIDVCCVVYITKAFMDRATKIIDKILEIERE